MKFDRDLVISTAQKLLPCFDSLLMRFAATEEHEVFPDGLFPWARTLEANWRTIRAEAETVLADRKAIPPVRELSPDHHLIAVDDSWRSYFLWGYGLKVEDHCAKCPETAKLLEQVPDLLTAFFSVMMAGAHVPRHTGPTKAILTGHLGLIVPADAAACHMRVGGQDKHWQEGRLFVFDDMYPHEVWNDTAEDRVILLLHVKRPLKFPGSALRDLFFAALRKSPFVQDGLKNLERWEKQRQASPPAAA